jgi:hypothetical protein
MGEGREEQAGSLRRLRLGAEAGQGNLKAVAVASALARVESQAQVACHMYHYHWPVGPAWWLADVAADHAVNRQGTEQVKVTKDRSKTKEEEIYETWIILLPPCIVA